MLRIDLETGLGFADLNGADLALGDMTEATDQRQQPTRLGLGLATGRQAIPDTGLEILAWLALGTVILRCRAGQEILCRGQGRHAGAQEGSGQLFGGEFLEQGVGIDLHRLIDLIGEDRVSHQALAVARTDIIRARRLGPFGLQLGIAQKTISAAPAGVRHDDRADALGAGPACPARAVQQHIGIGRQVGMDHQFQTRQVDAAGGDIGRHTDPGAAIAQGLQGVGAFFLGQFAGQGDGGKAAIAEAGRQPVHRFARGAEDDGALGIVIAQHIDDRIFAIGRGDRQGAVFDIGVLAALGNRRDTQGVFLEAAGNIGDGARHGGREEQGASARRRGVENVFEVFAEAEIEHLVGFVEDDGLEL